MPLARSRSALERCGLRGLRALPVSARALVPLFHHVSSQRSLSLPVAKQLPASPPTRPLRPPERLQPPRPLAPPPHSGSCHLTSSSSTRRQDGPDHCRHRGRRFVPCRRQPRHLARGLVRPPRGRRKPLSRLAHARLGRADTARDTLQSNIPASQQLIFFNGRQLTQPKDSLEVRPHSARFVQLLPRRTVESMLTPSAPVPTVLRRQGGRPPPVAPEEQRAEH